MYIYQMEHWQGLLMRLHIGWGVCCDLRVLGCELPGQCCQLCEGRKGLVVRQTDSCRWSTTAQLQQEVVPPQITNPRPGLSASSIGVRVAAYVVRLLDA